MSQRLHICRPGTYRTVSGRRVTLSAADLTACAAAYDPAAHQAPLVVGHPKTDDPALGWVSDLAADAAGELTAATESVADELKDAVSAGRYRTISASFFPPAHERNPKPGAWYLRHVGFLGAHEPAVKGLRRAELGAGDDDSIETLELAALSADTDTEPTMPDGNPTPPADGQQPTDTVDLAAERSAIEAERARLAADREALDAERARIDAERAERQAQEIADFAAGVVQQHHYAPHVQDTIRTVLTGVCQGAETVDFGAPEPGADPVKLSTEPALRRLVQALADPANRVPQGEATAPETADLAAGDPAEAAKYEYQRSPRLQAEFSSAETYAAYKRAEAAGRVRFGAGMNHQE